MTEAFLMSIRFWTGTAINLSCTSQVGSPLLVDAKLCELKQAVQRATSEANYARRLLESPVKSSLVPRKEVGVDCPHHRAVIDLRLFALILRRPANLVDDVARIART